MPSFGVVKVGGSLFDLPELGQRLSAWSKETGLARVLFVPGGGPTTNAVRELDRRHRLGEERAHWLALRALTLNAHFLADLLPGAAIVSDPGAALGAAWTILDCHSFVEADDGRPDHLPHTWSVTSDSVAARAARLARAIQLYLLKSVIAPKTADWAEAARIGYVDPFFPQAAAGLQVTMVNLRAWAPAE